MHRILIAGGGGYIGKHLVDNLLREGHFVCVVDTSSSGLLCEGDLSHDIERCVILRFDVLEEEKLTFVLKHYQITKVINCAAWKVVTVSNSQPIEYFANNIGAVVSVTQACLRSDLVDTLIFSGSASVYKDALTQEGCVEPPDENCEITCQSPYGATKYWGEQIQKTLLANNGSSIRFYGLRYYNPVGFVGTRKQMQVFMDTDDSLPSRILRTIEDGTNRIDVFGKDHLTEDGTCIRDFVHILDLVDAHTIFLTQSIDSGIYNIGRGAGISVLNLVKIFEAVYGVVIACDFKSRRPGEIVHSVADTRKIKSSTKWRAKRSLLDAVESYICSKNHSVQ